MTGFGVGALPDGRVVAEIRSVNQRFLDVRARLPREMADLSLFAEQIARERLRRGRVELLVHTEGSVVAACVLDKERARAAMRALGELRDELLPGAEVPLSLLSAVPDLFTAPHASETEAVRVALKGAIDAAIDAMDAMCLREGDTLAADLLARVVVLRAQLAEMPAAIASAREAAKRRARERVERLLAGHDAILDPARVEAEIALLAERGDATEELIRLSSHLEQLEAVIAVGGPEPVGRRLDFLLQEMVREANTLGAKAQDAALAQRVVAVKVELERLREQVQNIE
jgi:uncharacterized protein (TIGR00255 family)